VLGVDVLEKIKVLSIYRQRPFHSRISYDVIYFGEVVETRNLLVSNSPFVTRISVFTSSLISVGQTF
jgi:hypothetical protein